MGWEGGWGMRWNNSDLPFSGIALTTVSSRMSSSSSSLFCISAARFHSECRRAVKSVDPVPVPEDEDKDRESEHLERQLILAWLSLVQIQFAARSG